MKTMTDLLVLMRTLRDPDSGCPWDRKQTLSSLRAHSLDEIYELLAAIDTHDMPGLQDELGDLLFHIVFYAQVASEAGYFDFADVVSGIVDKLHRRHPHVFADANIASQQHLSWQWEAIKQAERQDRAGQMSLLDDIAVALPEIRRALKLQRRAASVGFDWSSLDAVAAKIGEEIDELTEAAATTDEERIEEELGDVLFSCVNLSRHLHCDPELALRAANRKFEQRFRYIEQAVQAKHQSLADTTTEERDALWQEAKQSA